MLISIKCWIESKANLYFTNNLRQKYINLGYRGIEFFLKLKKKNKINKHGQPFSPITVGWLPHSLHCYYKATMEFSMRLTVDTRRSQSLRSKVGLNL